jgi:alpha-N-arabinofuranosidase
VSAAGPSPADPRFRLAWDHLRALHADIIDEHCYALPDWFYANTHRYDHYDRAGPKVFMGEYAAQSVAIVSPKNRNNLDCALSEAAYLTGLERNADVVRMASYAPLFANTEAWQWTPDLIWVDSLHVLRTPSYHVQSLYARNRGDRVLPVTLGQLQGEEAQRLYASAVFDAAAGEVILKLVNATAAVSTIPVDLAGVRQVRTGSMTILQGDLNDENTMDTPDKVAPYTTAFSPAGAKFEVSLPAHSFSVVRVGVAP